MLKLDLLFNVIGALLFYVLSLLAQVNPPAEPELQQPGNVSASVAWGTGDIDVDMWLLAPGDSVVGYSRKSGSVWNLLRDDLGQARDVTPLNYENAYTRGTPDGEYVINLRCYRCTGPVETYVEVVMKNGIKVWSGSVRLRGGGDEKTAVRWKMRDGNIVRDSLNFVYKEVRK